MAEYDLDDELLSYDIVKFPSSGEFEIRLEEVDEVFTTEWTGPHHADRKHYTDNFGEMGAYEEVHRVETGDTVAILEVSMRDRCKKQVEWVRPDLNRGSPPCQGGVITS